jgi:hypothetical protein
MLYNVTLHNVADESERSFKIWATSTLDALKRAVGRCKRYEYPSEARETPNK